MLMCVACSVFTLTRSVETWQLLLCELLSAHAHRPLAASKSVQNLDYITNCNEVIFKVKLAQNIADGDRPHCKKELCILFLYGLFLLWSYTQCITGPDHSNSTSLCFITGNTSLSIPPTPKNKKNKNLVKHISYTTLAHWSIFQINSILFGLETYFGIFILYWIISNVYRKSLFLLLKY